ncbi:TPR-like protein [Pyrenochaeta sp. DS3sAY3a]|nr:TPR-like protein [Pyrenochaeta sp. DS3sAY3a]
MAEALAIVGAVASIVQLVDFGAKVLLRLNEFQANAGEVPKVYQHINNILPVLLETLTQTKISIEAGLIPEGTKNALLPAISGCRTQVEALDTVIGKVLPLASDSWREKSKKAFASLRQEGKVKKIRSEIQNYIQTLTYYHAAAASSTSRLPSYPHLTPSSTVPFRRDRDFIDRGLLAAIHEKCSEPASRVALVGLGGVGKSQLAIEYSYQVQDKSPDTWVFWVHAGSTARFEEGYKKIAERVEPRGWDKPGADILRLVSNWLCEKANGKWVMIIDNADDPDVFSAHGARSFSNEESAALKDTSLLDLLPQTSNGSILITSRNRELAYRLTGSNADIMKINPMDQSHALALLKKKLGTDVDDDDAATLLQMLDYMPLAISQVASYICQRAPRTTVHKYVQDLMRGDKERASLLRKDVGDARRDGKASNSIISSWQISFEHIRSAQPSAARLLSLMSLFDRQGIPEVLLIGYYEDPTTDTDFEDDIHMLTSYSLIEMSLGGTSFEMHRLVQFSTKAWLELNCELEAWKERYIMSLYWAFPRGEYENWDTCADLFPHAEKAAAYMPASDKYRELWCSLLHDSAWFADDKGWYAAAEAMSELAVQGYEELFGADNECTLASMTNLALTYWNQGKYAEAERLGLKVYAIEKHVRGEEAPETLCTLHNLALTYMSQGRVDEAQALQEQVLETRTRVLGERHVATLASTIRLAQTYVARERYAQAEALGNQAEKSCRRVFPKNHPMLLKALSCLAYTYRAQRRWDKAQQFETRVLEGRKLVLGADHIDTLVSAANLALAFRGQGELVKARELGVKTLEALKRVAGEEHPRTLDCMHNLGVTVWEMGQRGAAVEIMEVCAGMRGRRFGGEHPDSRESVEVLERWRGEIEMEGAGEEEGEIGGG